MLQNVTLPLYLQWATPFLSLGDDSRSHLQILRLITVTMSKLRKASAVHCRPRCTGLLSAEWSLNQVTSKQQHFCHLSKLHYIESPNTPQHEMMTLTMSRHDTALPGAARLGAAGPGCCSLPVSSGTRPQPGQCGHTASHAVTCTHCCLSTCQHSVNTRL